MKLDRFYVASTAGGNWQVIDRQSGNACPKLYKGTPVGDCIYPADDFQGRASAERFASKMNKEVATARYKKALAEHPEADRQILIASQY